MSDESIPSHSTFPVFDDVLGNPDELFLPHEQNISSRHTYPYLKVATPAASPGTVNEDKAIQHLLHSSLTREQIIDFVRIYKVSKAAGIYGALDIILGIRTDELPKRIHVVGKYP